MSDGLPNLPPPLPDDEVFLGRAIMNRRFRFLSVSQVVHFDVRQEGGCQKKWAYEKLFGKKEVIPTDDPRNQGKRFAREAELYLKYNYDALSPVMRAGKHLLPKPGSDLEVEEPLAGSPERTKAAIELRDKMLAGGDVTESDIERASLLSLSGIPFVGAADYCHQRGYYLTDGGVLVKEPHEDTAECGDHKTTARIRDHQTKPRKKGAKPIVLPGYAKTPEEIGNHPQMLGYGVRTKNKHPHIKWMRLSHNYYQRKNGYSADKRTILLPIEHIVERWRSSVAPVVREMVDVAATASKPEDVPFNNNSCQTFGRECAHASYCDRPLREFVDMAANWFGGGGTGTMDFSDLFPGSGNSNGVQQASDAPPASSLFPGVPAAPMSEEERARQIEAEKVKLTATAPSARHPLEGLDGYTVGQDCNGTGYYKNQDTMGGHIAVEVGHKCPRCMQAPRLPTMDGVNPVDQPHVDHIAAADALSPEAIGEIADPELRAKTEAHAKAVAERAAAEEAAKNLVSNKKPSGCSGVGKRLSMGDKEKLTRKAKCPGCGKEMKIKDKDIDMSGELVFVVPKHKLESASTPAPAPVVPATPTPVATPLPVTVTTPPNVPDIAQPVIPSLPPPLPVAPPALPPPPPVETSTLSVSQLAALTEAAPRSPAVLATTSTLYLNVVFVRGDSPKNLDEYARDIVKTLQTASKLDDLRYAPEQHELAFGRWKGALTKMVKANPLPAGEYVLQVHGSEVRECVAEAVADLLDARVVRGAA